MHNRTGMLTCLFVFFCFFFYLSSDAVAAGKERGSDSPPGWSKGEKKGWHSDTPPGLTKSKEAREKGGQIEEAVPDVEEEAEKQEEIEDQMTQENKDTGKAMKEKAQEKVQEKTRRGEQHQQRHRDTKQE